MAATKKTTAKKTTTSKATAKKATAKKAPAKRAPAKKATAKKATAKKAATATAPAAGRLAPGDKAPAFTLTSGSGEQVSLKDFAGEKVILFAYPAAMTPGCTKEACDFRDSLAPLQAAGYHVIGISPDAPAKLAKFADRDGLTYPLLSDPDKSVLTAYGAFGEKKMYGRTVTGVIRSTFVIDPKGVIDQAQYNVRATGHVAKLRKDLGV